MILLVIDSLCYTPALVTDNHIIQLFLVTSLKPNMNTLVCPGHRWLCNCSESERFTRVLLSQSLTPEQSWAVVTISSVAVTNQSNKVQSTHVSEHHWLVSAPELGVCQLWQWVCCDHWPQLRQLTLLWCGPGKAELPLTTPVHCVMVNTRLTSSVYIHCNDIILYYNVTLSGEGQGLDTNTK